MPASWAYGSEGHEDQSAAGQRRQFDGKAAALRSLFADSADAAVLDATRLIRSPPKHHRHRAQIAVVKTQRLLGMWDSASKQMVPIDHEAALFSAPILLAVKALQRPEVPDVLWHRLANVHAHSTAAGDICLTLCYARQGAPVKRGKAEGATRAGPEPPEDEDAWRAAAKNFRCELAAAGREITTGSGAAAPAGVPEPAEDGEIAAEQSSTGVVRACQIVGQWRKYSVVVGEEYVNEEVTLRDGGDPAFGRTLRYRQVAGQFSNPNPAVAAASLEWLCETCHTAVGGQAGNGSLLELHCGFAHSTIALAPHFSRVVGVELNRHLAATAEHNLQINGVTNGTILHAATADAADALLSGGALASWKLAPTVASRSVPTPEPEQPDCDVLLVDPPRAGLDAPTLKLARRFHHILYISCNPEALHQNLQGATCEQHSTADSFHVAEGSRPLLETHEVVRMAVFDMFPATGHVEMAVYLRKRSGACKQPEVVPGTLELAGCGLAGCAVAAAIVVRWAMK